MTKQYGLTLTGTIRVFRKDKEIQGNGKKKFTVTDCWFNTSEKEENGEYFNLSTNLIFNKDLPKPENNTVITISEAFPIITGNGKYRKVAYYVKDYTVSE
jgi:hypothetical protein